MRFIGKASALATILLAGASGAAAQRADPTATALNRCLSAAANASTAGQTGCEASALRSYDQRMNVAYTALLRGLPAGAAQQLRRSQRAWLAFRDAERSAIGGIYATRQGTMYVPMQAGSATTLTRDRALQLETYRRVMAIEP
ncbi:lysozyme inhibitor LprI family protein [Sphingomonas sp. ZT3P38]|uniref:lysozyme inhibitor LprI family protein n=1 Tax=Parasphingomonas zepuensis TaxID=3096161 RepID=UPI002FCB70F9